MNTNTEYVEPNNFKGSKGKFYAELEFKKDENMCPIRYIEISNSHDVTWLAQIAAGSFKTDEEAKANAILLSQSKEMAKAIQELLQLIEGIDLRSTYHPYPAQLKAKEVLNKALNINQ